MAKDVIITPLDGDIQFKNSSGNDSGKIEQSGDDLVLTNAVGDILIGDGSSDVFIGDGVNNVDIVFEQNGSIRGEAGSSIDITLGSSDTDLIISGSTFNINPDATFAGDVTFSKENASPSITFHNGGNDMGTNAALAEIDFTADYQGSPIAYGSIQLKTNTSSVRTDMDFVVKSTSGNQETALKLQGGAGKPKSFFYNDMSVEGDVSASAFIGDGSGLTGISIDGGNATTLDSIDSTQFLRSDESDTMSGNLSLEGNLLLTGTATTSSQARTIDFTGFDKEGTTDFTDRAYIQHTTNTGGHAGSVLVISSQNDSGDGIAFLTNASSQLKHNTYTIWTSGNDGPTSGLAAQTAATASYVAASDIDGSINADTLDSINSTQFLRSDESDTFTGTLTLDGQLDLSSTDTAANYIHLPRGGGITFYGDTSQHHGIFSRSSANGVSDDILISSYNKIFFDLDSNNNNTNSEFSIATHNGTTKIFNFSGETAHLTIGADNMTPILDLMFDDHGSGVTWDTRIQIGKTDDFAAQGIAPTYIATGGYGMQVQANSDGVFFGMEEYSTGNYRPIIQWGDDDTDSPFRIKHETGSELEISYNGDVTTTGDLTVNGGNIAVNNNNGGIQFNDGSSYWLRTATNWGIYWNTSSNQLQFHGAGSTKAFIDLDTGRIDSEEHVIANGSVYANGTGFVFGTSTSEGEYITRSGNDIRFVAGGNTRMHVDGDTGHVGIGTTSPGSRLTVEGSGSTIFDVQGSQGQLFSVTDDLTGDIFSVADISGIPILNINANGSSSFDGNLSIGTQTTYAKLTVAASSHNTGISVNRANDTTAAIYIGNDGGNNPVLASNNADMIFGRDVSGTFTERMRMTNSGSLMLNTSGQVIGNTGEVLYLYAGGTSGAGFQISEPSNEIYFKSIDSLLPENDNESNIGSSTRTFASGHFTNFTVDNDLTVGDQIFHAGDTNTYMQFHSADQWRVVTGGGERLEVNNSNTTVANTLITTGGIRLRSGAADQTASGDSSSNPSTTVAEIMKFEGNSYTNGQYTTELVKIDRGGNLPLYFRQSKGTANDFSNLIRIGDHSNNSEIFQVFGSAKVDSNLDVGGYLRTDEIRAIGGQDLTITCGESSGNLTKSTHNDEIIRLAGENGVRVYASSDNLTSGLNRQTTLIDASGNASFGQFSSFTTGGTARVTSKTAGTGNSGVALSMGTSNTNMSYVRQNGNGVFQWQTYNSGNSGQLHFQPYGGNVGIGSSSPSAKLDVNGDLKVDNGSIGINVTPSATDGRLDAGNDVVAYSTSDRRLKENIIPISDPLNKIKKINGVEFDWIPLTDSERRVIHGNEGHDVGVIAQEIEDILPVAVKQREHSKYKAVRYEKIIPLLIEAVKDQQDIIEELTNRLEKLENK